MSECKHTKTVIWEPHLAGARKCQDCGMVYNPNRNPVWFNEPMSIQEQNKIMFEALEWYASRGKYPGVARRALEEIK